MSERSAETVKKIEDNLTHIGGEGLFTPRLLDRCGHVVAVDFSGLAIRRARRRFAGEPRVEVKRLDVRARDLDRTFDLVFCAELFYYMNSAECEAVSTAHPVHQLALHHSIVL